MSTPSYGLPPQQPTPFQSMQGPAAQWPWLQSILQNVNNGSAGVTLPQPMTLPQMVPQSSPPASASPMASAPMAPQFGNAMVPFWMQRLGMMAPGASPIQPIQPIGGSTGNMPGAALQARPPTLPPAGSGMPQQPIPQSALVQAFGLSPQQAATAQQLGIPLSQASTVVDMNGNLMPFSHSK
jgi:hypothetical protein